MSHKKRVCRDKSNDERLRRRFAAVTLVSLSAAENRAAGHPTLPTQEGDATISR